MDIGLIQLIVAYTLVAVFVFTAIITSLSMIGVVVDGPSSSSARYTLISPFVNPRFSNVWVFIVLLKLF